MNDVKSDLIPELELSIIPTENGELQIELMDENFVTYLKEKEILNTDCLFQPVRNFPIFLERLKKAYKEYSER